jgi:hypothetical protein
MKRCPNCNRTYDDDSLTYCLHDGAALIPEVDPEATVVGTSRGSTPYEHIRRSRPAGLLSGGAWAALIVLAMAAGAGAVVIKHKLGERRSAVSAASQSAANATNEEHTRSPVIESSARSQSEASPPQTAPITTPNINGQWNVVNVVEQTSFPAYQNLRLGYRVLISQTGNDFVAHGEKILENGKRLGVAARTAIHFTGSITGNMASATFTEEGAKRSSNGRIVWQIDESGKRLVGTFSSDAADSSGSSVATR